MVAVYVADKFPFLAFYVKQNSCTHWNVCRMCVMSKRVVAGLAQELYSNLSPNESLMDFFSLMQSNLHFTLFIISLNCMYMGHTSTPIVPFLYFFLRCRKATASTS